MIKKAPFACLVTSALLGVIWVTAFHVSMSTTIGMKEDLIQAQAQQITQLKAGKPHETDKLENTPSAPLKVFEKKTFRNEKVLLDGYKYIDCTFENVTLVYNGGPSEVRGTRITFNESLPFETSSLAVKQIIKIFAAIGVLVPGSIVERIK